MGSTEITYTTGVFTNYNNFFENHFHEDVALTKLFFRFSVLILIPSSIVLHVAIKEGWFTKTSNAILVFFLNESKNMVCIWHHTKCHKKLIPGCINIHLIFFYLQRISIHFCLYALTTSDRKVALILHLYGSFINFQNLEKYIIPTKCKVEVFVKCGLVVLRLPYIIVSSSKSIRWIVYMFWLRDTLGIDYMIL